MATMKQLLEGDVHRLPEKSTRDMDYHLDRMRHHAKQASHYASLSSQHAMIQTMDDHEKFQHAQLAAVHSSASLMHGALKNHHYEKYKKSKEAKGSLHNQDTSRLPSNAVKLRARA